MEKSNIIKEMKDYTVRNEQETFLIEHDNKITFCNLETLNYMKNNLNVKLKILANCYCLWSQNFNIPKVTKF